MGEHFDSRTKQIGAGGKLRVSYFDIYWDESCEFTIYRIPCATIIWIFFVTNSTIWQEIVS